MPFDAEPKNGDFAAYVDRLVNQGGQAPGAGMSTEAWAAKASARALAQTKPAGFPTGQGTASGPGSHKPRASKKPAANPATYNTPGAQIQGAPKPPAGTNPNAWGRSGESTVPMISVPSSQTLPAPLLASLNGSPRLQQAAEVLSFIIKQFNNSRRS